MKGQARQYLPREELRFFFEGNNSITSHVIKHPINKPLFGKKDASLLNISSNTRVRWQKGENTGGGWFQGLLENTGRVTVSIEEALVISTEINGRATATRWKWAPAFRADLHYGRSLIGSGLLFVLRLLVLAGELREGFDRERDALRDLLRRPDVLRRWWRERSFRLILKGKKELSQKRDLCKKGKKRCMQKRKKEMYAKRKKDMYAKRKKSDAPDKREKRHVNEWWRFRDSWGGVSKVRPKGTFHMAPGPRQRLTLRCIRTPKPALPVRTVVTVVSRYLKCISSFDLLRTNMNAKDVAKEYSASNPKRNAWIYERVGLMLQLLLQIHITKRQKT